MLRSSRIRAVRPTPRRGQPTKKQKDELRLMVYGKTGGRCMLQRSPLCIRGVLPFTGPEPFDHWHLVHIQAKRVHGWAPENLTGGCWHCHLVVLHSYGKDGQKPCPPKPKPEVLA